MVWLDACLGASFKKILQSFVPERLNHTTKMYSVAFHMSMPYTHRAPITRMIHEGFYFTH
jgi:hypothetical protein